jgi:hypothetical protein
MKTKLHFTPIGESFIHNDTESVLNLGIMDYKLLRKQKRNLLAQMNFYEDAISTACDEKAKKFYRDSFETIEGMINLLDRIQDEAVKAGIPESKVFGRLK